jgi:hypothetical protein
MSWLSKLWDEIVTTIFMMVGITPPKSARRESSLKTSEKVEVGLSGGKTEDVADPQPMSKKEAAE